MLRGIILCDVPACRHTGAIEAVEARTCQRQGRCEGHNVAMPERLRRCSLDLCLRRRHRRSIRVSQSGLQARPTRCALSTPSSSLEPPEPSPPLARVSHRLPRRVPDPRVAWRAALHNMAGRHWHRERNIGRHAAHRWRTAHSGAITPHSCCSTAIVHRVCLTSFAWLKRHRVRNDL